MKSNSTYWNLQNPSKSIIKITILPLEFVEEIIKERLAYISLQHIDDNDGAYDKILGFLS